MKHLLTALLLTGAALLPATAHADCTNAALFAIGQQQCQSQGQGQSQSVMVGATLSQANSQHVSVSTTTNVSVPVTIVFEAPPQPPSVPLVWLWDYQFEWWSPRATGYVVQWQEYGQVKVTDVGTYVLSEPFGGCIQVAAYNDAGTSSWSRSVCGNHGSGA